MAMASSIHLEVDVPRSIMFLKRGKGTRLSTEFKGRKFPGPVLTSILPVPKFIKAPSMFSIIKLYKKNMPIAKPDRFIKRLISKASIEYDSACIK